MDDLLSSLSKITQRHEQTVDPLLARAGRLADRLREPRRFIQVVAGPRQVGKSTLVQPSAPFRWRELNHEVDLVVRAGRRTVAIEVKGGRSPQAHAGIQAFSSMFKVHRRMLLGADGVPVADFLSRPVTFWVGA